MSSRIETEKAMLRRMVRLYCRHRLGLPAASPAYEALADYAAQRLERCRWGEGKPACKVCPVHCYAPRQREEIRKIMRWVGPRMFLWAPAAAFRHLGQTLWHSVFPLKRKARFGKKTSLPTRNV